MGRYLQICIVWFFAHSMIMIYAIHLAHHSHSLGFKTFTHLLFFDFLRIIALLVAEWCKKQKPNLKYTYGYDRIEIISIFVTTVLTQIAVFFTLKDCFESFIEMMGDGQGAHSHSGTIKIDLNKLTISLILGYLSQFVITYVIRYFNKYDNPFDKAVSFCGSNHLQLQIMDLTNSVCGYLPVFVRKYISPHLFLNRQIGVQYNHYHNHINGTNEKLHEKRPFFIINNPFNILNFVSAITIYLAFRFWYIDPVTDHNSIHSKHASQNNTIMDLFCCKIIITATFMTLYPIAKSMAKILVQTVTPDYTVGHLEKCVKEASTLEGVLELTHEHFWVLSFGKMIGSVYVRCNRDADEQLVAAHVTDKLSPFLYDLTVQCVKDYHPVNHNYGISY